jgi:hypothetical protein
VLPNPFSEIGSRINRTLKAMVLAAAAGAAGVTALFFICLGAFLWLREVYGTINASLALGSFFSFLAFVALISAVVMRRRPTALREARPAETRAAPRPAPAQWWTDPMILTTAVQVVRTLGGRRTLPLTLAAVLAGFALSGAFSRRRSPSSPAPRPRPKPNGSGTFSDARN